MYVCIILHMYMLSSDWFHFCTIENCFFCENIIPFKHLNKSDFCSTIEITTSVHGTVAALSSCLLLCQALEIKARNAASEGDKAEVPAWPCGGWPMNQESAIPSPNPKIQQNEKNQKLL